MALITSTRRSGYRADPQGTRAAAARAGISRVNVLAIGPGPAGLTLVGRCAR